MRFVSIRKPHVHHERISVVGAFDPIRARLWFQSHRDKSHFPNYPVVAKNLRLEGTSAFRSRRRRMIALRGLNRTRAHSFPESNPCHPPALSEFGGQCRTAFETGNAPAASLESTLALQHQSFSPATSVLRSDDAALRSHDETRDSFELARLAPPTIRPKNRDGRTGSECALKCL